MAERPIGRLCVFCGSRPGSRPEYLAAARRVGETLARRGIGLVYGGASVGVMGAVADAALAHGGEVIGVIPEALAAKELAHRGVGDLRVVGSMHERKALMAELADGFIALPGGFGTFEELFEVITWSQLGLHRKPIGILNVAGFYDGLLGLVEHAVDQGFVPPEHRRLILTADDPDALVVLMLGYEPPPAVVKWIRPEQT